MADPTKADLRNINEHLLLSAIREQELTAALEVERAQLAVILASMGDAVEVVNTAGDVVRSNAAYAQLSGGAKTPLVPQDAQGQPLPPDQAPRARAARGETFSMQFTLPAPDGTRRWYEANGQPLQNGAAGYAVLVIRDITLSSQHRQLQDEFLALASHELRSPLTSIQGYLELVQDLLSRHPESDERLAIYAAKAQHQGRRLVALVADLVDVTRVQSGKLSLDLAPLEMGVLAAHAVDTARELARDMAQQHTRSITLEPSPTPLWVHGDAGRLEQVLLNLLTNALKYTPPTAPIAVRLSQSDGRVALAVQDEGPGIAANQLAHLFARFYQGARSDTATRSGLGLGLFICHELVTAHGGRLEVHSTAGIGTTFTVWLPLIETP
jgi:two-component system, chemotaxis family, CheB/CheR fusion protein